MFSHAAWYLVSIWHSHFASLRYPDSLTPPFFSYYPICLWLSGPISSYTTLSQSVFYFYFFLKIYLLCIQCFARIPEEGTRSHYRWLWANMWLLGIELRSSGRAARLLNYWAVSPAPNQFFKIITGTIHSWRLLYFPIIWSSSFSHSEMYFFVSLVILLCSWYKNSLLHIWSYVCSYQTSILATASCDHSALSL